MNQENSTKSEIKKTDVLFSRNVEYNKNSQANTTKLQANETKYAQMHSSEACKLVIENVKYYLCP
jgi:hypothetical protein